MTEIESKDKTEALIGLVLAILGVLIAIAFNHTIAGGLLTFIGLVWAYGNS